MVQSLTVESVGEMFERAYRRIVEHRDEMNAINVYPIPDGDTGTNMALTLEQAAKAAKAALTAATDLSVGTYLMGISRSAILGARGNSGVILAQFLRGFARHIAGQGEDPDGEAVASALAAGAQSAYSAVDVPVEGTILTVARAAGDAARTAAEMGGNVAKVLGAAAERARQAVVETTRLLPELARAGVVDSAGLGLAHMLEAMAEVIVGQGGGALASKELGAGTDPHLRNVVEEAGYGFEVQFVLEGTNLVLPEIRAAFHSLGESLVVVGDENLVKVHIHSREPERVLEVARSLGVPDVVTVENLDAQVALRHEKERLKREE